MSKNFFATDLHGFSRTMQVLAMASRVAHGLEHLCVTVGGCLGKVTVEERRF
jgi:hypothetical protein